MSNYEYYRVFYQVARCKNITKAAEILGNNQPNITRMMNQLEHDLGCQLMIRSNRGIQLTPEGEKFYRRVAIACEQIERGEEELREDQSLEKGTVTISVSETALRIFLLPRLEVFQRQYPGVRLRIVNHTTPSAIQALERKMADFAVVTSPADAGKNYISRSLLTFHDIPIVGKRFRSYTEKEVRLADLRNLPLITHVKGSCTRDFYAEYYHRRQLIYHPDLETATTDQILSMVMYNLGLGFVPDRMAEGAIEREEVYAISLDEQLPERQILLVREKHGRFSIAAERLMEVLMEDADQITNSEWNPHRKRGDF